MTQTAVADQIYRERPDIGADARLDEMELVQRLRRGDRSTFEQLVTIYQPAVYGWVYRCMGDAEDARDVVQETFLRVYQKIGQFRGESSLRTWIYRVAMHQASNHRRWWARRGRQRTMSIDEGWNGEPASMAETLADERPDGEQVLLERERENQLLRALLRLKRCYRAAVVLRDVEGCSYEEIARILGVSLGTVKSRIARGRDRLRRELIENHMEVLGD